MMNDMPQEVLVDAMQAQVVCPLWPSALQLQAACLFSLGMENYVQIALKDGTDMEASKNKNLKIIQIFLFWSLALYIERGYTLRKHFPESSKNH